MLKIIKRYTGRTLLKKKKRPKLNVNETVVILSSIYDLFLLKFDRIDNRGLPFLCQGETTTVRLNSHREFNHETGTPKKALVDFKGSPVIVDDAPTDAQPYA